MKNNLSMNYEAPMTEVFSFRIEAPLLVDSIGTASSESFQDESEFGSIW